MGFRCLWQNLEALLALYEGEKYVLTAGRGGKQARVAFKVMIAYERKCGNSGEGSIFVPCFGDLCASRYCSRIVLVYSVRAGVSLLSKLCVGVSKEIREIFIFTKTPNFIQLLIHSFNTFIELYIPLRVTFSYSCQWALQFSGRRNQRNFTPRHVASSVALPTWQNVKATRGA